MLPPELRQLANKGFKMQPDDNSSLKIKHLSAAIGGLPVGINDVQGGVVVALKKPLIYCPFED